MKTFITKVDTSSIADRFTLIVIKLFLAQNTSRNNTYSGFNKEIIEKEDANLEHRDRSIVRISPPIFLLPGVCLEARPSRVEMIPGSSHLMVNVLSVSSVGCHST